MALAQDLIRYAVHKAAGRPVGRFEIALDNLTRDEAHDYLALVAKHQAARTREVLLPSEWAAITNLDQ